LEGVDLLRQSRAEGSTQQPWWLLSADLTGRKHSPYTGTGPEDAEVLLPGGSQSSSTPFTRRLTRSCELIEYLPQMVFHIEDPVGRTESFLYYRLMEVAQKNGTVYLAER
jgi:hypothetical protein